jgi:DNA-binding NarL/FixJ family response regulator
MSMNKQVPAYILARPGRIRDSLVALLRAIPQIGPIQQVNQDLTELKSIPDYDQALVLLDASLINQEVWSYIKQVEEKNLQTHCKCIVLADTILQQRLARAAGADEVLLAGFPGEQLFATIENLFDRATVPSLEMKRKNGTTAT